MPEAAPESAEGQACLRRDILLHAETLAEELNLRLILETDGRAPLLYVEEVEVTDIRYGGTTAGFWEGLRSWKGLLERLRSWKGLLEGLRKSGRQIRSFLYRLWKPGRA